MAFEATKNFKKKSAGGRFDATSNFGVNDTVISSRVNAISKDIESLYNDYYKDYTERGKYVLGVDSKYENMQAPGLKVSMQSYKDRAKKIKQSIEDNKAFLTPEGYLAALQKVNSIIDTDTTEDDKTFSDYFNSSASAGGRDKFNKIVEERAAAQSALKKAGLSENSKYRDIEAALSDRTIDAGAAPDEMGQGRRYQGRKLTSEEKDYLSSLLMTEDKVSTMTDDEILRKIKDKGSPSYKQKIAMEEIDRLTKKNEELIKLAEADGNVSSFNPYGDYAEEYADNQQRMEKLRNMIDNDYAGRDVAYYYTDDNGINAMSWENLYYERKVGNAYKAATDKEYGGYNSSAAEAYDEINFIEKVTDAMQWLSENSTVSAEKKKPYLDIVKEYDEKYGTNYAEEDGIYGIETKNRINSEIKNSDALNKLKENFKSESGATYDAVKDYAKLQRDKERAANVQETVQAAVEGVNSVPVVGKVLGGIASAISAVPFALVSGTDYIFNLMDSIGHSDYNSDSFRPINTYDDYVTNISGEIIGAQTEIYDKAMQEAGVSETARKFWTSTYSGFSSGINSLATVVGSCYAFGPAAGQVVASVILSGQAASSGLQEAVQNGSTTNEALAYGFASGVAEYLGEKISIGSLVDKFLESSFDVTSFKSFMKSFVKDKNLLKMLGQGAVEGSEEVVTEIMNRFSDAVINQDHSKFSNAILTYEAEGLSREEAKKKAFLDVLASAAEQAWGGFVGGIMGGTAAVIGGGVSAARNSVADIKNQTDIGKSIAGTDAGKNVLELAEKRGLDISKASEEVPEGRGVGKLVSKVRNAVRNRNMGKLAQNVVEAELKAAKETAMPIVNNNESLAEMVAEIATGTADVSAISALSANGVLTEENVEKVFEALEAVQKRTETSEVRNMINDIVETKESSEGKAYNVSSIYGIKREGGKTKYILEDGTEVDSGEFGLTSKDKTLFVNAVKGMTDAEANEMISAYRKYANGTDKGVFATTWGLYRSLGETGAAKNGERVAGYKSRIYFTQNAEVNNVLVTSAIEQGVKARAQSEMKRNIKARAERVIQERGRAKGEVRGEEHLGKNKSGAKNVARTLAKLGYDVEFLSEDAKLHGKRIGDTLINGAYDEKTNTIYLRADAAYNATDVRGILGHTLAHEVTHSIKTWSEADYNVLTDYIRDALEADFDALVKEKMDKLGMSYAMASDEVIADGCEMLLRDSKALEKLATENASLFVKVVTKVREFIANLRKAQTDMYGGSEELHDAALKLREALKSLEEVQEVFDNALENSIRNMRNALAEAENAKTRENLDVLEKQAEKEGLHIENDGIKYSTEKTFDEQIDDVLNGKHNPRLDLYVSKTPGYLLKLNFSDSPMLMRNGKISEILNKHSDMSAEILKMIPKAIEDPVLVLKSKTNPANSVVIITDILTSKGEMIIPVWANQSGNYIDLDLGDISLNANFVASAYGRNTENLIKYAVNHNGVLYQNSDTKRVIQLLARNGLQLPTPLKLSDSIINVSEKGAAVNSKLQNSEELSERDAEYLKLAKDPKKNAAQLRKLVDDAAKAAGFTKRLYHGTQGFDSTRINTGYSDDGISFFMSDDERVTSWYSGTDEKKPIGKNISENGANNYEFYTNTENMYEINDYGAQWDNILDADALDSEDAINKAFPESEGFTWNENDGFLNVYRDDVFYGEYVWDDESDRYVPNLPGRDPLPSRADGFGAGTTRSLSRAIYDSGKYSGVIFRQIHDAGFDNGNTYADIYNFFYPESQVKSADLVTYDDNGNIIPLSERFNTEMNELRFSEETETSRDTLVSDMEAVAETDEEKSFVEKLKSEVKKANALQKELAEINRKIKEISFTKGTDRSALPSLNEEKERLAKKLNRLDSKFYGYRGYDTFKTLAERKSKEAVIAERLRGKEALRSQKQKYQEAAQGIKDTLAQREENRRRREIVRDIAKRIDKIDSIAKADSKAKHIPSALRQIVRDFRAAVDTRTQNYDERIAKVNEAVKKLEEKRSKYDVGSAEYEELSAQIEKKLALAETYGMRGEKAEKYLDGILEYYKTYGDGKSGTYLVTDELTSIIEGMKSTVGERPLYMLSADELEIVLNATKAVQKQIATANKLFKSSRSVSDTVNIAASQTNDRRNTKAVKNPAIRKMLSAATDFFYYNNLKPYELFKITGSQEMYNLYRRLQRSEGDSARLITKYADKYRETAKKNGVKEGMFGKDTRITLDSGKTIVITQGEALTLHLTQRREQGRTHLLGEGFKPKDGTVRFVENGKVKTRSSADFITLTENDLSKFGEAAGKNLTAFGEEMQNYMSTEMSNDGNGVSMALYDVKLFGEKNYISLDVDQSKRVMAIEKSTKPGRIENRGFTQKTVENATQGLLISSFDDVFASHATDMAAYAAFALPLNDMMRVINGKTADGVQLKALFGEKLSNSIQDFLNDVNGGIRSDNLAIPALFRSFKAAATGNNLRVAIQQPTAIMRSLSKLNPKYYEMFFSSNSRTRKTLSKQQKAKLLAEMEKHTSTWLVKELGGADINAKRSLGKEITYLGIRDTTAQGRFNTITEKQFWLAEKADQLTWMYIWSACKNEAIDKLKNRQKAHGIGYTYEDVLRMAGDRFDEVTNETQVYDSVFARSKIMRSSSFTAKLYTSFFAEASTTLNMAYEMVRQFASNNGKEAVKIATSLLFNGLFNIAMAAVVDAMRDDDDDQNFGEKYLEALFSNLLDNFEPMGYMPYFRDLISALKGYDVNRSDVELVSRFVTRFNKLKKAIEKEPRNDRELFESSADIALAVVDMFGIAGTNFKRDFMAVVDTVTKKSNWEEGTKTTLHSSVVDALNGTFRWGKEKSYSDKLYYAVMNDDSSYIERMKESNDEDGYKSLIKKGLKDHDLRVASAAVCHMDGDFDGYERYVNDIVKDGFDREHVVSAILSAENKLLKDGADEDEDVDLVYQIDGMTATKKDIYAEVEKGEYGLLEEYYRLKVDYYKEKEDEEPEKKAVTAVKNLLTSNYKEIYEDSDEDGKKKLREMLTDIKVDGHRLYTYDSIRKWDDK